MIPSWVDRPPSEARTNRQSGTLSGTYPLPNAHHARKQPLSEQKLANGLPARNEWFDAFARKASLLCGKPVVFLGAVVIVLVWAISGPLFNFSDTWQLVINTGTTIVTFLMVFLIQNTQNRDAMAVQVKLAELIIALKGAENRLANAEDLSEEELQQLHDEYRQKATATHEVLSTRRKKSPQLKIVSDKAEDK